MIDAHGHLEDEKYDEDREEILSNLKNDGVDYFFNCGSNIKTSKETVEIVNNYENVYGIVGIHPHDSKEATKENLDIIEELAKEPKIMAIGEIGLDFHFDDRESDEIQKDCFISQLELADKLDMPVVIHSRDADNETFEILSKFKETHPNLVAVLHCYSGDVELLEKYIKLGFYITMGGVVTFKNAELTREVAKAVPLDRIMLETDCPYLTPVPYRGKRNEPKYVRNTAEKIAEIKGISLEELEKHTDENAFRFYRI